MKVKYYFGDDIQLRFKSQESRVKNQDKKICFGAIQPAE